MKETLDPSQLTLPGIAADAVREVVQLSGGANNRVYRVSLHSGESRVLKRYFRHESDPRDRLKAEYGAFEFLWNHGIRCIPQPLGVDPANDCALYQHFEHRPFDRSTINERDIAQVLAFVTALRDAAKAPEAKTLPRASEACFSLDELFSVIDRRLRILSTAGRENGMLRDFLAGALTPFYDSAREGAVKNSPLGASDELPIELRTLSPSDLGFHNALLVADGRWIFQDFEYFGWDDPAKLIVDFELHPAMELSDSLKRHWRKHALEIFSAEPGLSDRVKNAVPTLWGEVVHHSAQRVRPRISSKARVCSTRSTRFAGSVGEADGEGEIVAGGVRGESAARLNGCTGGGQPRRALLSSSSACISPLSARSRRSAVRNAG